MNVIPLGTQPDLLDEYAQTIAAKSPATVDAYLRAIRQFTAWLQDRPGAGGHFFPDQFTRTAVETYLAQLDSEGYSVSHRSRLKAALAGFARWLIEEKEVLRRNPTRGVEVDRPCARRRRSCEKLDFGNPNGDSIVYLFRGDKTVRILLMSVVVIMIFLLTSCSLATQHRTAIGTSASTSVSSNGSAKECPYSGASVDVTYKKSLDLAEVKQVLVALGWNQTSVGTGSNDVINGTLEGATVSVLLPKEGGTVISVHFAKSGDEKDFLKDAEHAEGILRRVTTEVERVLKVPVNDQVRYRMNRGCEG